MGSNAGLKRCSYSKNLKVVKKKKKCKKETIKTHCYKSCTVCNSTLPDEIYSNSPVSSYTPIIEEISAKPSLMLIQNSSSMPSATPSLITSNIPSATVSNVPSFVYSAMPSIEPSANPSVYHSVTPTVIPSVVSSTKPSSIPSVSEESIQKCKNKSGKVYMGSNAGLKRCSYLKNLKVVKKKKKCKKETIKTHCYKSCTECNSTLPDEIYSNSPVSSYTPIIEEISAKPSLML